MSGRTVFVTGAYGLLGSWLAKALLARGDRVVALAYGEGDPGIALALYEAVTASTVDLLRRLGEAAGSRSAPHPELGPITVATLVERGIEHAAAHAAQVVELTGG